MYNNYILNDFVVHSQFKEPSLKEKVDINIVNKFIYKHIRLNFLF